MGFFGTYLYDGSQWMEHSIDRSPGIAEPWILVDIHDGDITAIMYSPTGPGSGVAYLGYTPRTYFEDEKASAPTDVAREAAGLVAWWAQLRGGASDSERRAKQNELAGYLAEDIDPSDIDVGGAHDDELNDAEIFVEIKTAHFLGALDLPVPDELSQ